MEGRFDWISLDASVGERILLHGTESTTLDKICSEGFDERVAKESCL